MVGWRFMKKAPSPETKHQAFITCERFNVRINSRSALLCALFLAILFAAPAIAQIGLDTSGAGGGAIIVGEADALACPGASNEYLGALRFVDSTKRLQGCVSSGWQDF